MTIKMCRRTTHVDRKRVGVLETGIAHAAFGKGAGRVRQSERLLCLVPAGFIIDPSVQEPPV